MSKRDFNVVVTSLFTTIAVNPPESKEARKAFEKFCEIQRVRILYMCRKYLKDSRIRDYESEAEDLTQEILLKLYSAVGKFKPEKGKALAWTHSIIVNELNDWYRKRKKNLTVFISLDSLEFADHLLIERESSSESSNSDPRRKLMRERRIKLRAVLNSLPPSWKEIVLTTMKFAPKGIPKAEQERIAMEYGISVTSINTFRMRAKKAIEKALGMKVNWSFLKELDKKQ